MLKRALDAVWPRGSAWAQKAGGGMEGLLLGISDSLDTVHDKLATLANIRNATRTEQLDELEIDFGISPDGTLTDDVRRARLDARINADHTAGTRDRLEREIQAAGFDLFVYANSPATNPLQFTSIYRTVAGGSKAVAGNPSAVAGVFGSDLLVNGDAIEYVLPVDPAAWPFIFFVGGVATHSGSGELTSIAIADVPGARRAELEETVLRLKGTYTWAVMVIHYT